MTQHDPDRPVLTALCFVAGAVVLLGLLAAQMSSSQLSEIIQTSAAAEAALDSGAIGYKAPSDISTIAGLGLNR